MNEDKRQSFWKKLIDRGASKELLLIVGIAGDLPSPDVYSSMDSSQKESFWTNRLKARYGSNWRQLIGYHLPFVRNRSNWLKEGF